MNAPMKLALSVEFASVPKLPVPVLSEAEVKFADDRLALSKIVPSSRLDETVPPFSRDALKLAAGALASWRVAPVSDPPEKRVLTRPEPMNVAPFKVEA